MTVDEPASLPAPRRRKFALAAVVLATGIAVVFGVAAFRTQGPSARAGRMSVVPAGSFTIGATDVSIWEAFPADRFARHESRRALEPRVVTLEAFSIDQTEVTVSAYEDCVAAAACTPSAPGWNCSSTGHRGSFPDRPVNCVTYVQAEAYCRFVGKELPREEQWEYAARGSEGRLYPWGNQAPDDTRLCWRRAEPCDAGSYPRGATPDGILDLAGSVWEITRSAYHTGQPADADTDYFVARGGPLAYAGNDELRARSSFRVPIRRFEYDTEVGFRCVRPAR